VQQLIYEHYLKGASLGDRVFSGLLTTDGSLYFVTDVGIKKRDRNGTSFKIFKPKGLFTYFSITTMFEDSKGNLWFGAYNGGLSKMNAKDSSFQYYDTRNGLASNWITSITEDRDGNVWIGHWKDNDNNGGLSRIEPTGQIKVFNSSNGMHDDRVWCIMQDHEGNMLIGTTDQGLEIFKGEKFVAITTKDGLAHNQVNSITEGFDNEIWFGTNQGISVYSNQGNKSVFRHYNQSSNAISNQINVFKKDRNKNIWIGTGDLGILLFNASAKRLVNQPQINSKLPYFTVSKGITALEITRDGHLWIGTIESLVEYDITKDSYVTSYTQGSGLAGNEITVLYADSKGDLWIGAGKNKGLTRLHNGTFTILKNVGEITPTCITEDRKGKTWIGTDTKGVLVMDNDSIRKIGTADGLLSNHINLLYCDENNNVYVGTNLGLNKIDQNRSKILSFTRKVGFTGIETKPNAWYMDSKGYLWIGTANGAMRCDLKLLSSGDTIKPEIRINEMLVKDQPMEMLPGKRFGSQQNDITFKYSSISLANPEGVTYRTMLEGYDEDWQNQNNENDKVYTKLPPGRYTFKVKARNEYGEWTAEPSFYSFRILAPPYKRGYFIITVIALILASIVVYIKIREKNLIEEKRILEARVSERTHALSEANNELSMKNKDILDSITYAKRIQLAILPSEILFDQTFILYKPKDIVSGDFYWMNISAGKEFLAAVDCTGHGVPGAFMSFIGYTSLNKIIIEQGIYQPSFILDRLNQEVASTLHQKGEAIVNDGMDIALICYTPATGLLEYAGAFNPLVIVRNGEIIETKADRFAIGRSTGNEKTFTNHEVTIEKGDSVYLYSDGYADQFGGPECKKFKTSALKELLVSISKFPTERQQKMLDKAFEDWKGNGEQIDDVLVLGRKF
jgi:ligand-binding sensor domain-containing protein/serine phosphatase RsbU (regulator of sigma subunit)